MPLGIVSDEEFEAELINVNHNIIHKDITRGRGNTVAVPPLIRQLAAEEAIAGVRASEISESLGLSQSSISAYKHDATSTASYHKPDPELKRANNEVRSEIIGTARNRLLQALSQITPEKLREAKLRDVASVAKDMSTIISNTEPQNVHPQVGAQFIFHVPKQRSEKDFDVIDVT